MSTAKLSPKTVKLIETSIDHIFEAVRAHSLGPDSIGKRFYIGHDPFLSLPGIFEHAAKLESVPADSQNLQNLVGIANNYFEAAKFRAKARVVSEIEAYLKTINSTNPEQDISTKLAQQLANIWDSVTFDVHRIVDTEAAKFKSVSILDGIIKSNAHAGIDDPTVFWVVVRDNSLCEECSRLHLRPDGIIPRAWKLSQVTHQYHKRGDEAPSISGLHPHCRCSMATLLPGWGFNHAGMVTWKGEGWDEYAFQQGIDNHTGGM